jgi:predicted permease
MRKALVIAQVCVSFLLLIGSGLFLQSLRNLRELDPGFDATNVVRFKLDPPLSGYEEQRTNAFFRNLKQRLEAQPSVQAAGFGVVAILEDSEWDSTINVEGYAHTDEENMNPYFNAVSPGYFNAMGIPVKLGRDFNEGDTAKSKDVVVVNETFVKHYFKDRNPIGYHIGFGRGATAKANMEIVGVVGDAKYENLRDNVPRQVFRASSQMGFNAGRVGYVRASLPSAEVIRMIRREVAQLDAGMPIYDVNTMVDQLDNSLSIERLVGYLSASFGMLATLLCLIGLYGVTAYTVTQRKREFGILMAIGAEAGHVLHKVFREVAVLALIGIVIGLPLVLALGQYVGSQLYGVEARDPLTIGTVALVLLMVAGLAGLFPAWRATRISPASVLRYE